MFRKTSQKSVLRERSKSQIFLYIIHCLHPKSLKGESPPCMRLVRKYWGQTKGKERTWMQWRVPPYFQLEPRTVTRCLCHRHLSLLIERIQVFRKTWKAAHSHMRTIHILSLQNQWRLLLAHPAGLSFTEGTSPWGSIIWAKNWFCTTGGIIISSVGQQHL